MSGFPDLVVSLGTDDEASYIHTYLYPDACREGAVPRVERHLVCHCQLTANCYQAARQPVNVAVAVFIRHRDRVR